MTEGHSRFLHRAAKPLRSDLSTDARSIALEGRMANQPPPRLAVELWLMEMGGFQMSLVTETRITVSIYQEATSRQLAGNEPKQQANTYPQNH
jgi:hypothetical protein